MDENYLLVLELIGEVGSDYKTILEKSKYHYSTLSEILKGLTEAGEIYEPRSGFFMKISRSQQTRGETNKMAEQTNIPQTQNTNTTPEAVKMPQVGVTISAPPATTSGAVPVQLGDVGPVEVPQVDLTQFVGRKTTIEMVETFKGDYGYYVAVTTKPLDEKGTFRARRNFGLDEGYVIDPANGSKIPKIGWGPKSDLTAFLNQKGVTHFNQLIGKEVVVQTKASKKDKTKLFLNFI